MTEVVTNTAASLQQAFAAERQQRPISVSGSTADTPANTNPALKPRGAQAPSAVARASKPDDAQPEPRRKQNDVNQAAKAKAAEAADANRPSKSESAPRAEAVKIELKDFDIGRRAAEVVGTVDVVQRFDNNADGRVDLLESQRAARARDSVFTYAARGVARSEGPSVAEEVQRTEIAQAASQAASQPATTSAAAGNPTTPNGTDAAIPKKIYQDAQVSTGGPEEDGAVPKKLFGSAEAASTGVFSDGAPVEQKFFGDGVELVRGRFASDPEVQQKLFDKAEGAEAGRFYEEGTGEEKLYDKVAQSETGRFYEDPSQRKLYDEEAVEVGPSGEYAEGEQTLYEKAQQVEAQTGSDVAAEEQPKKIYSELELYEDVAGYSEGEVIPPVTNSGPVTA